MQTNPFRTTLGENVFKNKYAQGAQDTWRNLAIRCVSDVCGTMENGTHPILGKEERDQLVQYIDQMKFIPGVATCTTQVESYTLGITAFY